jgi:hypothetical protein
MLGGSPPVDGSNPLSILRQLIDEDPVPLRQRNPAVPEEVAAICERALARDKDARHASAAELAEDIEAFLVTHPDWDGSTYPTRLRPISATKESIPPQPSEHRTWRRKPVAVGATVLVALTMLGLAVAFSARSYFGPADEPDEPVEEPVRSPAISRVSPGSAVAPRPSVEAKPAGRKGKAAAQPDPTAKALAMARELLQSGGSQSLARATRPKDRIKSLLEDLNVLLKANPENAEARFLRGRAYRRAGEMSSAILDFTRVLARESKNRDARTERLLAGYQLYVLYLGNLNERILRPLPLEDLDEDVQALLKEGDPVERHIARIVGALARQDYEGAGKFLDGATPTGVTSEDLPDVRMVEADALFHLAEES